MFLFWLMGHVDVSAIEIGESKIQVTDGFEVTQIYSVSAESEGSWVALCVDPTGRLIAGDQYGGLFRVSLNGEEVESVEALDIEVGHVNGLTFAFDSLYAVVAEDEYQGGGLYRIRDLDGDDQFDEVEYLRDFVAKGEHGPHSVIPGPEGKWLYVISGNKTPVPEGPGFSSIVPRHWGEDDLLPRFWGPVGSEKGTPAPGGWIARTDAEGKTWELVTIGLRNAYDIAFNQTGDLFTVDADAEFDMGTSWYQPTRLFHVVPGTDFGWRSGSGKWPPYYADTIPPVYEYGPGSPTGVTFGYGARFPQKYQRALYACDWSWGRLFVTWISRNGVSYTGETEAFLSGLPLPIADLVVNPFDGAMYFVLGGRGTTSGLYRIKYTDASDVSLLVSEPHQHSATNSPSVWQKLRSTDQVVRHEARITLENTPALEWKKQALIEENPVARLTALLALGRSGEKEDLSSLLASVLELNWKTFDREEELLALRCLDVAFLRMGSPGTGGEAIRAILENRFPSSDITRNAELLKLLVYLESDKATASAVDLLEDAVTQEDQLRFILPLRLHRKGWTQSLRERFFTVLGKAHAWSGGRGLMMYVEMMVEDALAGVPENERAFYRGIIEKSKPGQVDEHLQNRSFVKLWTMDDLLPISSNELESRDLANGRDAFMAANCFACHRVGSEGGGVGPDLTAAMRRFNTHDFLEAVIEPSKVISDQYGYSVIRKVDGTEIHGRVVNYYGDAIGLQTDSLKSANIDRIPRNEILSLEDSPVSPMPPGLLSVLSREDILDMLAFLQAQSGS